MICVRPLVYFLKTQCLTNSILQLKKVFTLHCYPAISVSDLLNIDPSIMQDVQRALKMKTRREARLKGSISSASTRPDSAGPSNPRLPPTRPASRPSPAAAFHHRSVSGPVSTAAELDFSPSTGQDKDQFALHPVPSLAEDGLTIDWSGTNGDDRGDKRWSLSGAKRKGKERAVVPAKAVLQQQDKEYASACFRLVLMCAISNWLFSSQADCMVYDVLLLLTPPVKHLSLLHSSRGVITSSTTLQ